MCIDCMSSRVLSLNKDVSRGGGVKGSRGNLRQLEGGKGEKKNANHKCKKKKKDCILQKRVRERESENCGKTYFTEK